MMCNLICCPSLDVPTDSQTVALVPSTPSFGQAVPPGSANIGNVSAVGIPGYAAGPSNTSSQALVPRKAPAMPKPQWHPPWKLCRVISGHIGWVRCVAVDPTNEWFCTGSADRVIKVIKTLDIVNKILNILYSSDLGLG